MKYKIEKGIPLPSARKAAAPCPYPFEEMKIGDSFVETCEKGRGAAVMSKMRGFAERYRKREQQDFGFALRLDPTGTTIRLWRVEFTAKVPRKRSDAGKPHTPPREPEERDSEPVTVRASANLAARPNSYVHRMDDRKKRR